MPSAKRDLAPSGLELVAMRIKERAPDMPPWNATVREATGFLELPRLALQLPSLLRIRTTRMCTIVVLPGFGADDRSTWPLRYYLQRLGHEVRGWGAGTNGGSVPDLVRKMGELTLALARERGKPIALVGWSLGGYIAREVARDLPSSVEQVVTLGSPVIGGPKYTRVASIVSRQGWDIDEIEQAVEDRKRVPLKVPVTAIYSRRDGVVSWQACIDGEGNELIEHVEVSSTHLGLGFSPDVYRIVAERLGAPPSREACNGSVRETA